MMSNRKLFELVRMNFLTAHQIQEQTFIKPDTLKHWRLRGKLKENVDYIKLSPRDYLYLRESIYKYAIEFDSK